MCFFVSPCLGGKSFFLFPQRVREGVGFMTISYDEPFGQDLMTAMRAFVDILSIFRYILTVLMFVDA